MRLSSKQPGYWGGNNRVCGIVVCINDSRRVTEILKLHYFTPSEIPLRPAALNITK